MREVRTRFAPSPTGRLHVGNLRVAIFNHLIARQAGGAFILRIEDTDLERNVPGALEAIFADLRWAGLDWDEGPDVGGAFGPYLQSERGDSHDRAAIRLLDEGKAYLCFCDEAAMSAARDSNPNAPGCPGGCRELDPDEARDRHRVRGGEGAIRFAVPDARVEFEDEIRGTIAWEGRDLGDFVILRADGRATYNFAVVVDDVEMEITHVIRGSGHLSNTPKQALLFDALGEERPVFAHLPMVLDDQRRKLSKRAGAVGIDEFRAAGYPPDAVVNYLSLLGWSAGDDREIYSRAELVEAMELSRVGASDTVFDPEKLAWVASQHIAAMSLEDLVSELEPWIDHDRFPELDGRTAQAVDTIRTRLSTFGEVNEHLLLLFPPPEVVEGGLRELTNEPDAARIVNAVSDLLEGFEPWTADSLGIAVREAGKALGVKGPALFHPVRLALSGSRSGPDLGKVMSALGREICTSRLRRALGSLSDG